MKHAGTAACRLDTTAQAFKRTRTPPFGTWRRMGRPPAGATENGPVCKAGAESHCTKAGSARPAGR
jgi:hypothetical protein